MSERYKRGVTSVQISFLIFWYNEKNADTANDDTIDDEQLQTTVNPLAVIDCPLCVYELLLLLSLLL
jgi:hypothetical protein